MIVISITDRYNIYKNLIRFFLLYTFIFIFNKDSTNGKCTNYEMQNKRKDTNTDKNSRRYALQYLKVKITKTSEIYLSHFVNNTVRRLLLLIFIPIKVSEMKNSVAAVPDRKGMK